MDAGRKQPATERKSGMTTSTAGLRGWPLLVARLLVFTALAATIALFVLALPQSLTNLATPCADPQNQCLIAPAQVAPLGRIDVAPLALAVAAIALSCLVLLLVNGVAAVLLWRRSNDAMALLVALTLILAPMNFTPVLHVLSSRNGILQVPAAILGAASSLSLLLLILLFPSGRFVPRWVWIPGLLLVFFGSPLGDMISLPLPEGFGALLILGLLLCIGAGQIYRYWRVSTEVERQQTKWVVYGFIFFIGINQLFWQPYVLIPALHQPDSLYLLLSYPDDFFAISILVVSFGIAILRYRLYDIDILIRRTLIYGTLTILLALVYFGLVIGLQALFHWITGQVSQSSVAIVASTLAIAALFQPLRRRIQRIIDRRFYRRKYDATKTVEAFSATLRNEVDLSQLRQHLLDVVQETMQPAHVSLWLRTPQPSAKQQSESTNRPQEP